MIKRSKFLPYLAQDLFSLVMDIERYHEFLPNCKQVTVILREDNKVVADLIVGNFLFNEKFRSDIIFHEPKRINITASGKTINKLDACWEFFESNEGCEVVFSIDIKMKNNLMQNVLFLIFEEFFEKILKAFTKEIESKILSIR